MTKNWETVERPECKWVPPANQCSFSSLDGRNPQRCKKKKWFHLTGTQGSEARLETAWTQCPEMRRQRVWTSHFPELMSDKDRILMGLGRTSSYPETRRANLKCDYSLQTPPQKNKLIHQLPQTQMTIPVACNYLLFSEKDPGLCRGSFRLNIRCWNGQNILSVLCVLVLWICFPVFWKQNRALTLEIVCVWGGGGGVAQKFKREIC